MGKQLKNTQSTYQLFNTGYSLTFSFKINVITRFNTF
jgi:hypothetical protein